MKRLLYKLWDTYLSKRLDFRVRLFNVLAMAGTLMSLAMAILGVANSAGAVNFVANLVTAVLSFVLLTYSQRSGKYQFCYMVTIIAIFLVLFPFLFFSSGGYHSGMPAFFVFAVAFTIFMLEGKKAVLLSALEIAVYIAVCLAAYYYPESVQPLDNEAAILTDVIAAFTAVSIILGTCMFLHFRLYNEQQRELARRNAELDRINRQKTEFLSNISHELKTPLTVVSSHVQIGQQELAEHPGTENLQNTMKLIGGEVERMALMVTQLLDVSRIDEGRMLITPRREDVVVMIQSTLDTYYPVFLKNRNKLTLHCADNIPQICCDSIRMMQVLVNLIGNATRHTRGGEITVSAQEKDGGVLITISDNGEGIAAEHIPYLFERYKSHQAAQNEETRTGWDTGTGLGLYICKYIVEAHGGRIWVESALGKGTDVHVILPPGT